MKKDLQGSPLEKMMNLHRVKLVFLFFIAIIPPFHGFCEGTKQLLPDSTISAAGLFFDNTNGNSYPNFGIIGCQPNYRLNIHVKNAGEYILFGLKATDVNLQFNLRKPNGAIALSGICPVSMGQTGYIRYYHQAIVGPFPYAGGYSPFSYQVTSTADTGNYYFELTNVPSYYNVIIDYWDFQVVSGQHSPPIPSDTINGRVWSQSWQVYADLGNYVFQPFNGRFFIYSDDGIVTKLSFSNAHVGAVTIFCNPYGCYNTGNFTSDRQSRNTNTYITFPGIAHYKVFLNNPDPLIYPSGVYGQIVGSPYMIQDPAFPPCSKEKQVVVNVDKTGLVEAIISFPYGGYSNNVNLYSQVIPGLNYISWNGLDGLGNTVPDGTVITGNITYVNGLTNLPIWDQERNPDGYVISLVRPVNPVNPVPLTYWDDSQLVPNITGNPCNNPPQTTNLTGCTPGSIPGYTGCHPWNLNLPDCHDKMINTWWFGSTSSASFTASFEGIPLNPSGYDGFRCGPGSVMLHATVLPFQTVDWYASPSGGTPLLTGDTTFITPVINTTTTYYAEARNTSTNCVSSSRTPVVAVIIPAPVPTISGPDSVCTGSFDNFYSTEAGMTDYNWSVSPGGAITSGTGTETITVIWNITGNQNVSVNYTDISGCAGVTPTVYDVTVNPLPIPAIDGPDSVCQATTNSYVTETGMTYYSWAVSSGGIIVNGAGTDSITVTWNATGNQSVAVSYTDQNGCTPLNPTLYDVTVNPLPVPSMTGPDSVCEGTAGNIYETEAGMTNYLWTISPGGVITGGNGTSQVTVTWNTPGMHLISVTFTDSNGCRAIGPASITVKVDPFPGTVGMITGTSMVCAGTQGVEYHVDPVPEADYYIWSVFPGATIVEGAGTNSIIVNFDTNAVSGNFLVYAANTCGNGLPSPLFPLTVNQSSFADAGADLSTCEYSPVTMSASSAKDYIFLFWTTSGTGFFDDPSVLHPIYTPGEEDITNGSVTLKLTASAEAPCEDHSDSLLLIIAKQAIVNSGRDKTLCAGERILMNDALATNYDFLTWSTSGDGIFSDPHIINPVYTPGSEDIQNGNVLLILSVSSVSPCIQVKDTLMLTFTPAPFANSGPDRAVCMDVPFQIKGADAENFSTIEWTHNGKGTLTGSSTLSPIYEPASGETGNVILTLIARGYNACKDTLATSRMNLTIYEAPIAGAGPDKFIESGTSANLSGSAEGGSGFYSFIWEPSALFTDNTGETPETVKLNQDTTIIMHVTDIVSGCTGTDSLHIRITGSPVPPEEECIVIHNVISPNGDGSNDNWIIDCIENFPDNEVMIFDRWGDKVNEFSNYDNHLKVWQGTNFRDEIVPDGTYYYVLIIRNGGKYAGWIFVRGGSR